MIKAFSTVILLLLLLPADLSFAQATPEGIKIYSGYLHQYKTKGKSSFWHRLFSGSPKEEEVVYGRRCSVEFKSPVPFSHQSVSVIPDHLAYVIKFKNGPLSPEKMVIKIYTNSEEEYSIGPDSDGKIFDSYLIYLILGQDINHLEVASPSGDPRYVLDKLEIHDNQ